MCNQSAAGRLPKVRKPFGFITSEANWILNLSGVLDFQNMATRNGTNASIHLKEAMTPLIRNQAAFVGQISRNDQERLALQRKAKEWQTQK